MKSFKKIKIIKPETARFQENVEQALKPITDARIIDGILIKEVSLLSADDNFINHKLGRKVQGWLVVRKRADSRVWDLQDSNVNDTKTLKLKCSADVTVDLWIF